jgi:hypothetical protein
VAQASSMRIAWRFNPSDGSGRLVRLRDDPYANSLPPEAFPLLFRDLEYLQTGFGRKDGEGGVARNGKKQPVQFTGVR